MPPKENEVSGVKVRSPEGDESEVCSQNAADSLCENHGFVDVVKEKARLAAEKEAKSIAQKAAEAADKAEKKK